MVGQYEDQRLQITSTGRSVGTVTADSMALEGTHVADVFPVRFFGQREIYNIAEDRSATVALVDDLHREELSRLAREEQSMRTDLNAVAQRALEAVPLKRELAQVQAQKARAITARDRLREAAKPLEAQVSAEDRVRTLEALLSSSDGLRPDCSAALDSAAALLDGIDAQDDVALREIKAGWSTALEAFGRKLRGALDELDDTIQSLRSSAAAMEIHQTAKDAADETTEIRQSLKDQGIDVEQFGSLLLSTGRLEALGGFGLPGRCGGA